MNYTSIEQSKKLIELGLSPKTSDCNWQHAPGYENYEGEITGFWDEPEWGQSGDSKDLPCWSLDALLEVMPKVISVPVDERSAYFYRLEWQFANDNSLRYIATNRGKCLIDIYSNHDIRNKSFIETAFEMVVWLLENGYIETEKK